MMHAVVHFVTADFFLFAGSTAQHRMLHFPNPTEFSPHSINEFVLFYNLILSLKLSYHLKAYLLIYRIKTNVQSIIEFSMYNTILLP